MNTQSMDHAHRYSDGVDIDSGFGGYARCKGFEADTISEECGDVSGRPAPRAEDDDHRERQPGRPPGRRRPQAGDRNVRRLKVQHQDDNCAGV